MKNRLFQIITNIFAIVIAIYVTGFRLFSFVFEFGFKTPQTDNYKNFIVYNLPDFISVLFCLFFVVYFSKRLKRVITNKKCK